MSTTSFLLAAFVSLFILQGCDLCDDPSAPGLVNGRPDLMYSEAGSFDGWVQVSKIFRAKADGSEQRVFQTTSGYITSTGMLHSAPVNGRLVFWGNPRPGPVDELRVDLAVANIDGSEAKAIAMYKDAHDVLNPVISPDGSHVAVSDDRRERTCDLIVYDVATGNSVLVANDMQNESYVRFSPDGTRLFYYTAENSIVSINLSGTDKRVHVTDAYSNNDYSSNLDISPDGKKMVYQRPGQHSTESTLAIFDFTSGNSTPIGAETGTLGAWPVWSPDGGSIAFVGVAQPNVTMALTLYVFDVNSGALRPLTNAINEWPSYPQWSPDGLQIAAMVTVGEAIDRGTYTVRVFDATSGTSTLINTNVGMPFWVR